MNPITLPIFITIALIGVIAIILAKLFYKDLEVSGLSDDIPPIFSKHLKEPLKEDIIETKDLNNHKFVTKSWEEPMGTNQEPKNGIASKVFQEPMHSKHQDIINKNYEKEDNNSYIQTENVQVNREYGENKQSNLDSFENENYGNSDSFDEFESFKYFEGGNFNEDASKSNFNENDYTNKDNDNILNNTSKNTNDNYNIDLEENNKRSLKIRKSEDLDYLNSAYIIPKENSSQNYEESININEREEFGPNRDIYIKDNRNYFNSYENDNEYINSDKISQDYNSYKKEHLTNSGVFDMSDEIIVEGKPYTIKVGDEIIFNYNSETYSSRILEIKHGNIRIKYRTQEKWISFSDIKKVF